MRGILILAAGLILSPSLCAQYPFGQATPVGGYAPALFGEPIWIGNWDYGYRIRGAPPGGSALIAVSTARQDQSISGLQVYLDLGGVLITHPATFDASGSAAIPLPLTSPDDPALTGLQFWAQAAVTDPVTNGLGTTQGLAIEIKAHPLLAVFHVTGQIKLVDPVLGTITPVAGLSPSESVGTMVFGRGGRDLFVATASGILLVDTFATPPQAIALGVPSGSLSFDRTHQRVYVLSPTALSVLDADRASPTFGSIVASVPETAISMAVSADGSVLGFGTYPFGLTRRVADPASPAYLQVIPTPPPPPPTSNAFGTSFGPVRVSPDGRVMSLGVYQQIYQLVNELHRFDAVAGAWIDHNPVAAGVQPLSVATHSSLPPKFIEFPSADGSSLVLGDVGGAVRIDLDLSTPSNIVASVTAAAPLAAFADSWIGLTPSGRNLIRRRFNFGGGPDPLVLWRVNLDTGVESPLAIFQEGSFASYTHTAWR